MMTSSPQMDYRSDTEAKELTPIQSAPRPHVNGWIPFPTSVCSYFKKGTCLRIGCTFFHGTDASLQEQQNKGASLYRVNDGAIYYGVVPSEPTTSSDDANPGAVNNSEGSSNSLPLAAVSSSSAPSAAVPKLSATTDHNTIRLQDPQCNVVACLSFLSGNCSRHDCRFVHLRSDIRLLPPNVCAYHRSPPGCQKGSSCRYFHGTQSELVTMKERGVVMYNPFTNQPYDSLPEQLEDPHVRTPHSHHHHHYQPPHPHRHHHHHQHFRGDHWQQRTPPPFYPSFQPQTHQQLFQPASTQFVLVQNSAPSQLLDDQPGHSTQFYLVQPPQQQQQQYIVLAPPIMTADGNGLAMLTGSQSAASSDVQYFITGSM